jgi:two-component system chemotaxis response regulator CheB
VSLQIVKVQQELIAKIKAAAQSAIGQSRKSMPAAQPTLGPPAIADGLAVPSVVAVGISTGGPKALQTILPLLPSDVNVPILVVQHMPPGFTGPFARRLDNLCRVHVAEAQAGDILQPGVVYIAPAGWHLTVVRRTLSKVAVHLSHSPEHYFHMPAVDVMMMSVAGVFHASALGVIMTGMGSDGLVGMQAIAREGGMTIGQDEASCAVYGMPRSCAEAGILHRVSGLMELPRQILQATRYGMTPSLASH